MRPLFTALATLALILLAALPARAGDAATLEILGFSADGGIFAFEQYGVQDGSGFPYAERFYVDVDNDSWLPGTPIRVRLDDETASVEQARQEARDQAQPIVADDELSAHRGFTAGMNPVTEYSADPHRMAVNPRPVFPPIDDPLEFRIEEVTVSPPERCEGLGWDIKGFRLIRIAAVPGGTTELVHEDGASVPSSRGCPLGYAIGAIQAYFPQGGSPAYAVLVAIRTFGFEGPDHRWMAIVGRL